MNEAAMIGRIREVWQRQQTQPHPDPNDEAWLIDNIGAMLDYIVELRAQLAQQKSVTHPTLTPEVKESAMRASAWLVDMLNDHRGDGMDDLRADVIVWRSWLAQRPAAQPVQAEWEPAQYNDIINVDNGVQLRVVIGQSERVHLHIRKRVEGEWKHFYVTTLANDYRIQRQRPATSGEDTTP